MNGRRKRVDEAWKNQAEEEKRKMEAQFAPPPSPHPSDGRGQGAGEPGDDVAGEASPSEPPAGRMSFLTLVENLAAQAMAGLGQVADPQTGRPFLDLDLARDSIDLIGMLEQKTRGNLTPDEEGTLREILQSLRVGYTTVSRAAKKG